jgi:CheY-like chemotaxis protein
MTTTQPVPTPVLIVEDDALTRRALAVTLQGKGYGVLTAAHGRAALEQLRAGPRPCVILLDLAMPVMDGYQFRAEQRRDPALADIPVIIITGMPDAPAAARALLAADHFDKPVDPDALLGAVARHCGPPGARGCG